MPELKDHTVHPYLDDWLGPVPSYQVGVQAAGQLVSTCTDVGLKSQLIPTQHFTYLGTERT